MRYDLNRRGTILITALWIVSILTVFAVSVGKQSAISMKLTSYSMDKLKAYYLARAGMMRAISEKQLEYKRNLSNTIDALSQRWASNEELFKEHRLGEGRYTVGYKPLDRAEDEEELILYGLMDEQSKININTASFGTIKNLILGTGIDGDDAQDIAAATIDWRDEDSEIFIPEDEVTYGAEDEYYQGLSPAYHCKNEDFDSIYELILIRGMTQDIMDKISLYITTYGEGKVNINTASEKALDALFGPDFEDLALKIIRYRKGSDGELGTQDDRWFCLGSYTIDRAEEGLVEIKNLQDGEWYANIYGITTEEYSRIKELATGSDAELDVKSKAYRAISVGEVDGVKEALIAVYEFTDKDESPKVRFWYQE